MPPADEPPTTRRRLALALALGLAVLLLALAGYRMIKPGLPAVEFREALHSNAETDPVAAPSSVPEVRNPRLVDMPVLLCATADTSGHKLQVGLRLTVDGERAAAFVRERRDGVEKIVRFVFSGLTPAELRADVVRFRLLEKLNAYLTDAPVVDITFTAFDIVP